MAVGRVLLGKSRVRRSSNPARGMGMCGSSDPGWISPFTHHLSSRPLPSSLLFSLHLSLAQHLHTFSSLCRNLWGPRSFVLTPRLSQRSRFTSSRPHPLRSWQGRKKNKIKTPEATVNPSSRSLIHTRLVRAVLVSPMSRGLSHRL